MYQYEKRQNQFIHGQKQAILLNASELEKQTQNIDNHTSAYNMMQQDNKTLNTEKNLAEEPNGAYTLSSIFSQHFLTDISKAFKEKKVIQKVLPTKFTRECLETTIDETSAAKNSEDASKY